MPTGLEQVVRPIAPVDTTPPPRTVPQVEAAPAEDVLLEWGKPGGDVFKASEQFISEFQVENSQVELSRRVDVYRVSHPDSPDSFVDIESVRQVTFRTKDGSSQTNNYTQLDPNRFNFAEYQVRALQKNVEVKNNDTSNT